MITACTSHTTPEDISSNTASREEERPASHNKVRPVPSCLQSTLVSETGNGSDGVHETVCSSTVSTSNNQRPNIHVQINMKQKKRKPRYNSVSKIDRAYRIVFPLSFIAINAFYWYVYLSNRKRNQQISSDDTLE
jgi:hypothetical protein